MSNADFLRGLTDNGQSGSFYAVDVKRGRLVMEDCRVRSDGLAAVAVHGSADPLVRRNEIHDSAASGLFIFDDARFSTGPDHGFYSVDSIEGSWNSGNEEPGGNLAFKPRAQEGYFPTPPLDKHQDIRTEMVLTMETRVLGGAAAVAETKRKTELESQSH